MGDDTAIVTVVKAFPEDAGNEVARLSPGVMDEIGVTDGGVVAIDGPDGEEDVEVREDSPLTHSEDEPYDGGPRIRLDYRTRAKVGAEIGQEVIVEPDDENEGEDGEGDAPIFGPRGEQTHTYVGWELEQHGEVVLWGRGTLHVDSPALEDYTVNITERSVPRDEIPMRVWLLTEPEGYPDPYRDDYAGFAFGEVNRKMKPEVTPDITAVEMKPAEGFNHALLGGSHVSMEGFTRD